MNEFLNKVISSNIGKVEKNVFLSKYTTYKVGGIAKAIIYPKKDEKLVEVINLIKYYQVKYKILGNGSNLLFSDKKYDGVLIKLTEFNKIEWNGNKVTVGAGVSLPRLSHLAAKRSLTGLEFASGIPGTIGGAVFMNAGAYKSDMGYIVTNVKVLTPGLKIIVMTNREMNFHYRTSFLKKHPNYVCLEATIKLARGKKEAIEEVINERRKRRISSQPLEYASAGSVFRN
ncbi:MAG: UDP-N-acetylmuramate dehydrogenase, partial [Romboutsia sp.]|nr:UDP-N-acetylmuramate dehydrogenase [Romboutsia sp.]